MQLGTISLYFSLGLLALLIAIILYLAALRLLTYLHQSQLNMMKHVDQKIDQTSSALQLEIRNSVQEKFIKIDPGTENLIDLAITWWRLTKNISKAEDSLSEDLNKSLENSLAKLERFLRKNDLEVKEYTGMKYNPGMNLELISSEKDPAIKESIIKETFEPSVLYKGQVIKRAKVIIIER